jgi:LysM repeat protein
MALPSQSARTASLGRSYMASKKKRSMKPLLGGAAVVLVVGVAGWAMMRTGDGHQDVSPPTVVNAAKPAPKVEAAPSRPVEQPRVVAQEPPKQEPVLEIRQGVGQPGVLGAPAPVQEVQRQVVAPAAPPQTQPPAPRPSAPAASSNLPTDLQAKLSAARAKDNERDWVAARFLYTQAVADPRLSEAERTQVRERLTVINDELVFSPKVSKDDPYAALYTVESGDSLIKIAQKLRTSADWRLLQRINRMSNPGSLSVGQKLKYISHPFHGVVHKYAYRMDVYLGPAERPEQWVYVRSLRVGLGEADSTPVGSFVVRKASKMVNPPWTNPRTGERFAGGDPKNPIGKYWIGLEGLGEAAAYTGYGIHGTIEPESIGHQRSMGCVRLLDQDIALMYELLTEQGSTVQIRP